MGKGIYWVLLIAVGVFIGIFGYERFTEYRAQIAIQQLLDDQEAVKKRRNEQRIAELQRQRIKRLEENTLCAMNNDTGKCACIHKNTGQKISKPYEECVDRASRAANIRRINN